MMDELNNGTPVILNIKQEDEKKKKKIKKKPFPQTSTFE
jgi:hypothetical protein